MSKTPFTDLEHLGAGLLLNTIEDDLCVLANALGDAYGVLTFDKVMRTLKSVRRLRSTLDSKVCSENPPQVNEIEGIGLFQVYSRWDQPAGPLPQREAARRRLVEAATAGLNKLHGGNR